MKQPAVTNASALILALREAPVDPAAVADLKRRVQSKLSTSLLDLPPAATTEGANAGSSSILRPAASGARRAVASSNKSIVLAALAPVFALGVLVGVAGDRWRLHHQAASPGHDQPAPPVAVGIASSAQVVEEPVVTAEQLAPEPPPNKPSPITNTAGPSDAVSTLAAERALLDQARQALARGEPGVGLAPLARHASRFPKGILTEEREALAVRLLTAAGNATAAATRAEAFHRRFPNSLFTPAVDNALATVSRQNGTATPKP